MKNKARYIANKDNYSIRLGYLKSYGGEELANALPEYNKLSPEVDIAITSGNHNELIQKIFDNELDVKFTDQRRAFSEDFVNFFDMYAIFLYKT